MRDPPPPGTFETNVQAYEKVPHGSAHVTTLFEIAIEEDPHALLTAEFLLNFAHRKKSPCIPTWRCESIMKAPKVKEIERKISMVKP